MADLSQTLNTNLNSNPIVGEPKPTPPAATNQTEDIYKKLGLNQPQQRFAALPVPDVKKQMAAREQFAKPGLEKEQALTKELGQFEGQKALADVESQVLEAEGMKTAYADYAKAMKMDEFKKERQDIKDGLNKPFIPTQENAQDLAQLFSLVNVVGFAFGALAI